MSISAGEQVALMGPSGSGKSTLLNCLSGIDQPDRGSINIAGLELTTARAGELAGLRRGCVSTVFQFFHLLPTLTAYENIELSLQLTGMPARERRDRVEDLLEAVQLTSHTQAYPETLSGGERQRVAIARALAHRPRLLLADEPTGSLDTQTGAAILDLLRQLADRFSIAMLLVTHSPEATRICQRTVHMRDGRMD
jgi:ABC-type lipoprotein export system ATPase subunit